MQSFLYILLNLFPCSSNVHYIHYTDLMANYCLNKQMQHKNIIICIISLQICSLLNSHRHHLTVESIEYIALFYVQFLGTNKIVVTKCYHFPQKAKVAGLLEKKLILVGKKLVITQQRGSCLGGDISYRNSLQ